jgi:hypothetical protein
MDATLSWQLNFVTAPKIVGPQYGTSFMSSSCHLEIRGGSQIFGKFVHPWSKVLRVHMCMSEPIYYI